MSWEVKRYNGLLDNMGHDCFYVRASDYDALLAEREARDWEMKAKGILTVIHLVVSKADQGVLREYANDMLTEAKRLAALQGKQP